MLCRAVDYVGVLFVVVAYVIISFSTATAILSDELDYLLVADYEFVHSCSGLALL